MDNDKIVLFFKEMETWRFIALVLFGVVAGMFVTADHVIDQMVDNYNNCQYDNFMLENPQYTQNQKDQFNFTDTVIKLINGTGEGLS